MNTELEKAALIAQSRELFDQNECGGLLILAIDESQTSVDVVKFGIPELDAHGKKTLREALRRVMDQLAA